MLPLVLVSFLVSAALAGPLIPVSVTQYNVNETPLPVDDGRPVNGGIIQRAFESVLDGGETNIYALTAEQIIIDLAKQPDSYSQALAVGQALALLGELAPGVAGDACEAAAVVNAYADRVRTGNTAGLRSALSAYLRRLTNNIDMIVRLANDPDSVRYASGPKGNCAGGGRRYQYEAAWNAILDNAGPYQIGLVNEQYCAARRLYSALNNRSNNLGAAVSAASVAPVVKAVQQAIGPLADFVRAVGNGSNPANLAGPAKQALIAAGGNVPL